MLDTVWLIVLGGFLAGVGATLVVRGARGELVDDRPLCRRCRFDLSGLREPDRCPECGGGLEGKRAVLRGLRRWRPGMVVTGGVVAMAGVVLLTAPWAARATGFDWNTVKPAWVLAREVGSGDPGRASAAVRELRDRLEADELGGRSVDAVLRGVLRRQGSPDLPWLPEAGELVESLIVAERVRGEDVERYFRQGIGVEVVSWRAMPADGRGMVGLRVTSDRLSGVHLPVLVMRQVELWRDGMRDSPLVTGAVEPYIQAAGDARRVDSLGLPRSRLREDDEGRAVLEGRYAVRVLRPGVVYADIDLRALDPEAWLERETLSTITGEFRIPLAQ